MLTAIILVIMFILIFTLFLMCGKLYGMLKDTVNLIGGIINFLTTDFLNREEKEND